MKQFEVLLPPPLNSLYKINKRTGSMYKDPDAKAYTESIGWQVKSEIKRVPYDKDTPLHFAVAFHIVRDRDIDGGLKLLLDSLEGICYENDSQIHRLEVDKIFATEPKAIVKILPLIYREGNLVSEDVNEFDSESTTEPF